MPESYLPAHIKCFLNEERKKHLMTGPAAEYMSKIAGEKEKNEVPSMA
jgi:hypothetical protein